jgi:hypothetical protein
VSEHDPSGLGHESRDIRVRPVVLAFVALLVIAGVVHFLMYVVLVGFTAREARRSEAASPLAATYGMKAPPEPRLQVAPRDDLQRLRAAEDALLHSYAWVDREKGVARFPIDRAIEILASRGLPAAAAPSAEAAGGTP